MSRRQVRHFRFDREAFRDARGDLSQEKLARELDVTVRTVQRWEHGDSEPKLSQIYGMASVLGVDPLALYFEEMSAA